MLLYQHPLFTVEESESQEAVRCLAIFSQLEPALLKSLTPGERIGPLLGAKWGPTER